jgi:ATP-dependent 26S proteasome regulatory subunit
MSLADDVDLEELIMTKDDLSGADIKAVCSGYFVETSRLTSLLKDFLFLLL